jgi:hypothetical protein
MSTTNHHWKFFVSCMSLKQILDEPARRLLFNLFGVGVEDADDEAVWLKVGPLCVGFELADDWVTA